MMKKILVITLTTSLFALSPIASAHTAIGENDFFEYKPSVMSWFRSFTNNSTHNVHYSVQAKRQGEYRTFGGQNYICFDTNPTTNEAEKGYLKSNQFKITLNKQGKWSSLWTKNVVINGGKTTLKWKAEWKWSYSLTLEKENKKDGVTVSDNNAKFYDCN